MTKPYIEITANILSSMAGHTDQLGDWYFGTFGPFIMNFLNLAFLEKVIKCVTCIFESSMVNLYKCLDGAVLYKSINKYIDWVVFLP